MIFGQKVFSNRFDQFYENVFGIKKENSFKKPFSFFDYISKGASLVG